MSKVTSTMIGAKMLGSTWRAMTRNDDAPEARAASTYSLCRSTRTALRTIRA